MDQLKQATQALPATPSRHFCIAPFQSIRQNPHGRNSPCAFGAGEWRHADLTPLQRWHSAELNALREKFIAGEQADECHRCWNEEQAGKVSLRQRQYEYFPRDYQDLVRSGRWVDGPKTAVFKSSNVCNLACRSCGGWDSNTFAREGEHYAELYHTQGSINGETRVYNRFMQLSPPRHMDFMQYRDIAGNLEKIDFFGGEPFLNITQLDLLEYLVDQGLSKNITLFYSTNCTNHPTARLKRAWSKFRRVEISLSIDGVDTEFEYLRWPGKWETALEVISHIKSLDSVLECEVYVMAGLTVSTLNVLSVDATHQWLEANVGNVYVNMVESPDYLALHSIPEYAKIHVRQQVKHAEALGYLDLKPADPAAWRQFLIWTRRQDLYRKQNLPEYLPGLYNLIRRDWDSTTDLSEDNFNSKGTL